MASVLGVRNKTWRFDCSCVVVSVGAGVSHPRPKSRASASHPDEHGSPARVAGGVDGHPWRATDRARVPSRAHRLRRYEASHCAPDVTRKRPRRTVRTGAVSSPTRRKFSEAVPTRGRGFLTPHRYRNDRSDAWCRQSAGLMVWSARTLHRSGRFGQRTLTVDRISAGETRRWCTQTYMQQAGGR